MNVVNKDRYRGFELVYNTGTLTVKKESGHNTVLECSSYQDGMIKAKTLIDGWYRDKQRHI